MDKKTILILVAVGAVWFLLLRDLPLSTLPGTVVVAVGVLLWRLARIERHIRANRDHSIPSLEGGIGTSTDVVVHAIGRVEADTEAIREALERLVANVHSEAEDRLVARGQIGAIQDAVAELTRTVRRAAETNARSGF